MSVDILDLFGGEREPIAPRAPDEKPPRTNYTERNADYLERGIHPATGRKVLTPEGRTCGGCAFKAQIGKYIKCRRHRLGMSRSEASDIRASWPACTEWKPPETVTL